VDRPVFFVSISHHDRRERQHFFKHEHDRVQDSAEKVLVRACVLTFLGRNIGWSVIKDTMIEEKTL